MSRQFHLKNRSSQGFTLIELLIVIAIILILIAIALPNFLEAQIRARVTKAKGEMRSLGTAMQAYYLDWNRYPAYSFPNYTVQQLPQTKGFTWLTTPNAYITSIPHDPFPGDQDPDGGSLFGPPYSYTLDGVQTPFQEITALHPHGLGPANLKSWAIYSIGPDTPTAETRAESNSTPLCSGGCSDFIASYSPTNGTKSRGDLLLYGGDQLWMGVFVPNLDARKGCIKDGSCPSNGQIVDGQRYVHRFPDGLAIF